MRIAPVALLALIALQPVQAADDPSIPARLKSEARKAMLSHIDAGKVDGRNFFHDGVTGHVVALRFAELHAGVVRKGDFYVSCADFTRPDGKLVDIDFLVAGSSDGLRVIEAIVHKVDGDKRPYHVDASRAPTDG